MRVAPGLIATLSLVAACDAQPGVPVADLLMTDAIDIRIDVPAVTAQDLINPQLAESSADVAARVAAARSMQQARYRGIGRPDIRTNSQCSTSLIEQVARPDQSGQALLNDAAEKMRFSARAYHRILKVARTLADLDGAETVSRIHLAESISYRIGAERVSVAA